MKTTIKMPAIFTSPTALTMMGSPVAREVEEAAYRTGVARRDSIM